MRCAVLPELCKNSEACTDSRVVDHCLPVTWADLVQTARHWPTGTEDGHIHKCSTSYSEQYLESYTGHIGPVYALQWSPFNKSLFISCSGDWTVRLWQEGRCAQVYITPESHSPYSSSIISIWQWPAVLSI